MHDVWRNWRRSRISVPFAVVFSVALLMVSEISYHESVDAASDLDAAIDARILNQSLLRTVLNAETGQRGYLITGEAQYLRPYQQASVEVRQNLQSLRQRYRGDADAAPVFNELDRLVGLKMDELARTVALRSAGNRDWNAIVESDAGMHQMDAIRDLASQLIAHEQKIIVADRRNLQRVLRLNRIGIAVLVAVCLIAFAIFLRQANQLRQLQQRQREQLLNENVALEEKVQQRTMRLVRLMTHLQKVREDERARLARDLHDELGALLVAAKLDLARLKAHLPGTDAYIAQRLHHLGDALNQGIAFKRRIIEDLHPSSLTKLGLAASIEILAKEFSERTGIDARCNLHKLPLPTDTALTIYRLVQEALTNIAKHARADAVAICIATDEGAIRVEIGDDGVGFDPQKTPVSAHGLEGMRYRVAAHGGDLQIYSTPGHGTRICARIPSQHPQFLSNAPALHRWFPDQNKSDSADS